MRQTVHVFTSTWLEMTNKSKKYGKKNRRRAWCGDESFECAFGFGKRVFPL